MMIGRPLERVLPGASPRASRARELLRVEGLSSPAGFQRRLVHAARGRGAGPRRAGGRRPLRGRAGAVRPRSAGERSRRASRGDAGACRGSPQPQAMRAGIGLVPEDRKRQGLVLRMTRAHNTTLPILRRLSRLAFVRRRGRARRWRSDYFERLRVRAAGAATPPSPALSGGNQQKIVLAKWLAARCADPDPRRADARRGRRRQGGDPRAHRRARRRAAAA